MRSLLPSPAVLVALRTDGPVAVTVPQSTCCPSTTQAAPGANVWTSSIPLRSKRPKRGKTTVFCSETVCNLGLRSISAFTPASAFHFSRTASGTLPGAATAASAAVSGRSKSTGRPSTCWTTTLLINNTPSSRAARSRAAAAVVVVALEE